MKAIKANLILTSARTRNDGSLGLQFGTSELQPSEKTAFFELLNQNLAVIIQPITDPVDSIVECKGVLGFKSPSQRLRSVLYVLYQQTKPVDTLWEEFYTRKIEAMIERIKSQLTPE